MESIRKDSIFGKAAKRINSQIGFRIDLVELILKESIAD